jgi:hypothetical protein
MIGVLGTPAAFRCSCQRGCSAAVVPQATWWIEPAPCCARVGRPVEGDRAAAPLAAELERRRRPEPLGAEHVDEQSAARARAGCRRARPRSRAARARRDLGVESAQRRVGDVLDEQLVLEALGVGEAHGALARRSRSTSSSRAAAPRRRATRRPTRQTTRYAPCPGPTRPRAAPGYSKKVRSDPGVAVLVGVEEVVDGRVVLVDRLRDEPQAEHAACRSRRCAARRR